MAVEFITTSAKAYFERRVNVRAKINGDVKPVRRTKTLYFTPNQILIELLETTDQLLKVKKIVLIDEDGAQAFFGEDWETAAPEWTRKYVRYLLRVNWENKDPLEELTDEQIEAHRQERAVLRDDPFVSARRVKCAYDRCGNVLQATGDEHPWIAARRQGWKLCWGLSDPTGTDLWCNLDHDSYGNPIHKN